MKIQLIDLGMRKVNKTVTVKDENAMWREIGTHLMSKNISLVETDTENKYTVYAGVRSVGHIIVSEN